MSSSTSAPSPGPATGSRRMAGEAPDERGGSHRPADGAAEAGAADAAGPPGRERPPRALTGEDRPVLSSYGAAPGTEGDCDANVRSTAWSDTRLTGLSR